MKLPVRICSEDNCTFVVKDDKEKILVTGLNEKQSKALNKIFLQHKRERTDISDVETVYKVSICSGENYTFVVKDNKENILVTGLNTEQARILNKIFLHQGQELVDSLCREIEEKQCREAFKNTDGTCMGYKKSKRNIEAVDRCKECDQFELYDQN